MLELMKADGAKNRTLLHALVAVVWFLLVIASGLISIPFDFKAGAVGSNPVIYPSRSKIKRAYHRQTLLIFVHPRCSCSKASLSELEKIVCCAQGRIETNIIFLSYAGQEKDWHHTTLWQAANNIPGATLITDFDGTEAMLFGARTSGQTLLYDEDGKLLFQGGITAARGHEGDNVGRKTIEDLVYKPAVRGANSLVFGCPLFD